MMCESSSVQPPATKDHNAPVFEPRNYRQTRRDVFLAHKFAFITSTTTSELSITSSETRSPGLRLPLACRLRPLPISRDNPSDAREQQDSPGSRTTIKHQDRRGAGHTIASCWSQGITTSRGDSRQHFPVRALLSVWRCEQQKKIIERLPRISILSCRSA